MEQDQELDTPDEADELDQLMEEFVQTSRYVGVVRPWRETPETDESEDEPEQTTTLADEYRDAINLPDISSVTFPTIAGAIQPTKPTRKPRKPGEKRRSVRWHDLTLGRAPTPFEAHVLSLHDIVGHFGTANDQLVLSLTGSREVALIRALDLVDGPSLSPDDTASLLREAQAEMARYGAYEVRRELRRQGAVIPEPEPGEDVGSTVASEPLMAQSLNMSADRLNQEWAADLQRHAIRLQRTKRTKNLKVDWVTAAASSIGYGLKTASKKLLNEAFAAGRRAEALRLSMLFNLMVVRRGDKWCVVSHNSEKTFGCHETKEEAAAQLRAIEVQKHSDVIALKRSSDGFIDLVVQSAVIDGNLCDECEKIDGETYEYGSDEQIQNEPPYFLCLGGDSCRCIQLFVVGNWRDREDIDEDPEYVVTEKQADKIVDRRSREDPYPKK